MNSRYTPFDQRWNDGPGRTNFCSRLIEIYPKVRTDAAYGGTTVDIVAIHGLSSSSDTAWTTSKGVNWLRDFLPNAMMPSDERQLPDARVMTFSYNSNIAFGRDWRLIGDQANDLLELLRCAAKDPQQPGRPSQRPIVFVCHSQGGILFKKALILSEQTADHPLQQLKGVIFLGTPHHGSRSVLVHLTWGVSSRIRYLGHEKELAEKYDSKTPGKLRSDLGVLTDINERFLWLITEGFTTTDHSGREVCTSFGIRNFYESKKMHHISKIVDKEAADMRFNEPPRVTTMEMPNVNHTQISKFERESDGNYQMVLESIIYMFRGMQNELNRNSGKGLAATIAARQREEATMETTETSRFGYQSPSSYNEYQTPSMSYNGYQAPLSHSETQPTQYSTSYNGYQPPSTSYNGYQPPSTSYNGYQPPSTSYNGYQPPSTSYNGYQPPSISYNGYQPSFITDNGYQPPLSSSYSGT